MDHRATGPGSSTAKLAIALASDHAGYQLKEHLKGLLVQEGWKVSDLGVYCPDPVDYPDLAVELAGRVAKGEFDRGILVCGTGIGMCIAANKIPGIRAALCGDVYSARAAREHNDANVLCLGSRVTGPALAWEITRTYLGCEFAGGRHRRRVAKIEELERKNR